MLRSLFRSSQLVGASVRALSAAAPNTATAKVDKDALMKLRKRTGYSYVNCRKALVEFGPDRLDEAVAWLRELAHKEGWAKAAKLSSRQTSQGLVSVASSGSVAAVIELSCETDFVSRGDAFKALVESLTMWVLGHGQGNMEKNTGKSLLKKTVDIASLNAPNGTALSEVVAMAVGRLGENIAVKKAELLFAPEGTNVFGAAHPKEGTEHVAMGKFVSLVALRRADKPGLFPTERLAAQLCQHVIGMRSETLGTPPTEQAKQEQKSVEEGKGDELNEFFDGKVTEIDGEETALLRQAFMLNPSQTIHEYVSGHEAEIVDFVRTELGGGAKDE